MRRTARFAALLLAALAPALAAQQATDALARGLDLERQGRMEDAAAAYRTALARDPTDAQALLGAERVYTQLGRRDSIAAAVARALTTDPANALARTIDVRTSRAIGGEPAAAQAIARWMTAAPQSEAPWREVVRSLLANGAGAEARAAIAAARRRTGRPDALRPELARAEAAEGRWPQSAAEWLAVVAADPDLQSTAAFNLRSAPPDEHEAVIAVLTRPDTSTAPRRVAADLLLAWQQPDRAWTVLQTALPPDFEERRRVVLPFADRARAQPLPAPRRVAASALELLAASAPPAEATELRIQSARVWAEAGDATAARRVLRALADDPLAGAEAGAAAAAALVEVEAREGRPAEAERLLQRARAQLTGSESVQLGRSVARAWIAAGELDRAERLLGADSALAADEIRGWIALYRGELAAARGLLRAGGVRGDAARAVDRAGVLVLLEAVRADTLPALGAALLRAERRDTLGAARAVMALGRQPGASGAAELLHLAAQWSLAAGEQAQAEALWLEVLERWPDAAPTPAALLALARAEAARGAWAAAASRLEGLILRYPESALVPEARRLRDQLRGLVPRS